MTKHLHPLTLFLWFALIISMCVITMNPFCLAAGFIGAALFLICQKGHAALKIIGFSFFIVVIVALTNPVFSHNGATILFFVNDTRITLEALIYGIAAGVKLASVVLWFSCFNAVFDSERLIYIIGRAFPKLALVISMSLGLVPRMLRDFRSINSSLRAVEKRRIKRYLGAFSALFTRSMEDAIVTADSMRARGYGLKGRTFFNRFRFKTRDAVYSLVFTALFVISVVLNVEPEFYHFYSCELSFGFMFFAVLALIMSAFELKESLKWKLSISRI